MTAYIEIPRSARLRKEAYSHITWEVMPEETEVSLPVPAHRDSRLVAVFFGTIVLPLPDGTNSEMYRPMVTIYVDWEEERVLEHQLAPDIVPVDQDEPVGLYLPIEFAGLPMKELEEKIGDAQWDLLELLDEVAPLYDRSDLTEVERELVARCNRAYRRVVHPDVWPFYEELNPDFFRWLAAGVDTGGTCPNCGAANPSGSRFCSQCGKELAH
jgi:hypothetical protein